MMNTTRWHNHFVLDIHTSDPHFYFEILSSSSTLSYFTFCSSRMIEISCYLQLYLEWPMQCLFCHCEHFYHHRILISQLSCMSVSIYNESISLVTYSAATVNFNFISHFFSAKWCFETIFHVPYINSLHFV
jgi:hypothetical protein